MKKIYISPFLSVKAVKVEYLLLDNSPITDFVDNTGGTSGKPGVESWQPGMQTAKEGGLTDWDDL